MKFLSAEQISDFVVRYYNRPEEQKNLRLGQMFCNEQNITCPALFYERDDKEAIRYIYENFSTNEGSD